MRGPHIRSALVTLAFLVVLSLLKPVHTAAVSEIAPKYAFQTQISKPDWILSSQHEYTPSIHLFPRGRWGDGSHRYAPARFTYRAPIPEEKPPVLIATKPLPSNRPNPKPHAKGYKGYLKKLHSTQRTVRGRSPFKFKIKSMLGAYGKKNGKVRPLTYETADFNWTSKYKNVNFLHREDRP